MGYQQDLIMLTEFCPLPNLKEIRIFVPKLHGGIFTARGPVEFTSTTKRYPEVAADIHGVEFTLSEELFCYAANNNGQFPDASIVLLREYERAIHLDNVTFLGIINNKMSILCDLRAEDILDKIGYGYELCVEKNEHIKGLEKKETDQPFLERFRFLVED